MKTTARILTLATFAFAAALPLQAPSQANPPVAAEVTPQPANTERAKARANRQNKGNARGKMKENVAKRDQKMIEEFETMFGRKLTVDQKTQLSKAAETRNAALMAAQEAYNKEFAQISGVTEKELREKRREARQKEMAANGGAANGGAPNAGAPNAARKARRNKNQNPGNLPDGTPADAPGIAAPVETPAEVPAN